MGNPINTQIQNLRLRIEILQDERIIEERTTYELSQRTDFQLAGRDDIRYMDERKSIEKVRQIESRIVVLEEELYQMELDRPDEVRPGRTYLTL